MGRAHLVYMSLVGAILVMASLFLLIIPPHMVRAYELPVYVFMWVVSVISVIPPSAYRIFVKKDPKLQKQRGVFLASWIYLIAGAAISIIIVALYPNWEVWTTLPMEPYSLYNPYTFLAVVIVPVLILYYNLILLPEGREEIMKWQAKRKRNSDMQRAEVSR